MIGTNSPAACDSTLHERSSFDEADFGYFQIPCCILNVIRCFVVSRQAKMYCYIISYPSVVRSVISVHFLRDPWRHTDQ